MDDRGICKRCHKPMYYASNGEYACRNFDCPPGTAAKHYKSWDLVKKYKPLLRSMPSALFTVDELSLLLQRDNTGEQDGPRMEEMFKRLHGQDSQDAKVGQVNG